MLDGVLEIGQEERDRLEVSFYRKLRKR